MIQFRSVDLTRGGKPLLKNISFTIHNGHHVSVTGINGCGKSSLFALVTGNIQPDAGNVSVPSSLRITHMEQEIVALDRPAIEYVLDGDRQLRIIEQRIIDAEIQEDHQTLSNLYDDLLVHDGYTAKTRAEQLLHGLGFQQHQINKKVADFSGGWRMRLNLAKTLMCPSDLLLLDEPTNHMDLEAILWLESWLLKYKGTLIFISHDRNFIDNIAHHIIHIEHQTATMYTGNYTAFERMRSEILLQQQASYEKQQRQKTHMQKFINRFKAKASKAKQAQSRLKALEKMESIAPAHLDSPFRFSLTAHDKMSNPLLTVGQGVIGYEGKPLLDNINFSLHPENCIGLLGPNGTGKSTLIKAMTNTGCFLSGDITSGEHLKTGYFAQHQVETLDPAASPFLHIQRISPSARDQDIRDFLGQFNFKGDKALELVKSFSGGERARVALAIIAWQKPNLLLLDEPTNHLDIEMRYALTVALQDFCGAVVLVSHDRSLMESVVSEFWVISDNTVRCFDGDLADYAKWCKSKNLPSENKNTPSGQKQARQNETKKRKMLQKHHKTIQQLEKEMGTIQEAQDETEKTLASSDLYTDDNDDKINMLTQQQKTLANQMETLESKWLKVNELIEHLQ